MPRRPVPRPRLLFSPSRCCGRSPSVADPVRQLGDPSLRSARRAAGSSLGVARGLSPELEPAHKGADPETAYRIAQGPASPWSVYKDAIRRLLADVRDEHEASTALRVPVSDELRWRRSPPTSRAPATSCCRSWRTRRHKLHRQTLRAFVATWDVATPDQSTPYVRQAVTLNTTHRPQVPGQGRGDDLVRGPAPRGLVRLAESGRTAFLFRTRTTRYLDGKPYDKPFDYQYPFATVGWYRVGELAEGKHTIHAVLEVRSSPRTAEKRKGQIRSKDSTFEVGVGGDAGRPGRPAVEGAVEGGPRVCWLSSLIR